MEHIIDPATAGFEDQWHFSHVVRSRGLLFLSGVTGTGTDGRVAEDPTEQFEQLFTHLRQYLNVAGADLDDLVEMTTYHIDLQIHLQAFTTVKETARVLGIGLRTLHDKMKRYGLRKPRP